MLCAYTCTQRPHWRNPRMFNATRRGSAHAVLSSKKLAREAEVQPLVALVLGMSDIVTLLLLAHSRPLRLLLLVPPHVVDLCAYEQHNRQDVDAEEGFVAAVV